MAWGEEPYPDTIILTFTGVGDGVDGEYTLTRNEEAEIGVGWEYWLENEETINVAYYTLQEPPWITYAAYTLNGADLFVGRSETPFDTYIENDPETGSGVATISTSPKATNPTPADGAVNVSKNITTFSWEIET